MSGTEDYNRPPNIQQWESTPMSAATRAECNECARRDYVVMLTRSFVTDIIKEESNDEQSQDS